MNDQAAHGSGRLLYLTDDLGGGAGNHLLSLAEHCHRAGWSVEVVSFAPRTARRSPDLPVRRLPTPSGPSVYPLRQLARFRQVRRLVRDRRPDLVHAYFFWPLLYSRVLRKLGSVPRLVENREDEGFNWGRHEYTWLRATRSVPDRVICVSRAVERVVQEREGIESTRTTVIRNGIEEPSPVDREEVEALRNELGIPAEAPVVGMVANLNREVKGVGLFFDVASIVVDELPRARLVVVGQLGERAELEERAAAAGVGNAVRFAGYREDIERFYGLMDVSVLTSSTEGLSITLLESMGHGVPVVATRVGGNPEVVDAGATGFLVPLGDRETFAARVIELLRDRELRRQMGEAARKRVCSEFRLGDTARRYERLYRSLLGGREEESTEGDRSGGSE